MADTTVSDALVERLQVWGVDRVFGYSGDGINGVMAALDRTDGAVALVQARHEENAAFMAVGHAKYTGGVGVVVSTQGPGAIQLLNGLYDAKLDGVSVVAVVGQQALSVLGSEYLQEVNLLQLFSDVAAQFVQQISSPEQIPLVIDRAFRTAIATRSPAVVIVPDDVQKAPAAELSPEHGIGVTAAGAPQPRVIPADPDLDAAAAVLNAGSRVAFLVGQGARSAAAEVVELAERLGAGIATSLLGKPHLDESLPFAVGTMGHLGSTASADLFGRCDTLLIVGSNDRGRSSTLRPARRARCRSTSIRATWGTATRSRWAWWATPARRFATSSTAFREVGAPGGARRWRSRSAGGAGSPRSAPRRPPTRSTRSPRSGSSAPGCQRMRSSPWTSAASSTGTPASWSSRRASRRMCRAPSPRWGAGSPTGSPRSSRNRHDRSWC